ncbi:ATP-dependent DNA helicase pif1 [Linum perenne]
MGGKVNHFLSQGRGPYVFCISGQIYHSIGSLLPSEGAKPKFGELYIYDTENEVKNRIEAVSNSKDKDSLRSSLVSDLKEMLDAHNILVKTFRYAKERLMDDNMQELKIKLFAQRKTDGREYDLPTGDELAALIVNDSGQATYEQDIIAEHQNSRLERISVYHPSLMALQYPLLFPYGEDGWRSDIEVCSRTTDDDSDGKMLTQCDFYAYRLQTRLGEGHTLLLSGKVFQQYVVNAYALIEAERLEWIRDNQRKLRVNYYNGLMDAFLQGDTNVHLTGKHIILSSTHTSSPRYKFENFQDAMAICRWGGYPDLFLTFTCNSQWPEIQLMVDLVTSTGRKDPNRADIIARVFKLKLNKLLEEITVKKIFGRTTAHVEVVEFQKRGLPHVHMLIFLAEEDKLNSASNIDSVIQAEIPDRYSDPKCYEAVTKFMIHGPCGSLNPTSSCTVEGKCTKHFPKKYCSQTTFDEDGFPRYRRRENGSFVTANNITVDNRFVVPYNRYLLLRFQEHINLEFCNKSRSIKYLFKYINKPPDRANAAIIAEDANGKPASDSSDVAPEVSTWASGRKMRRIFATMLAFSQVSNVKDLWERNWELLSEDILYNQRRMLNRPNLTLCVDEIKDICLLEIQKFLQGIGTSLENFQGPGGTGKTFLWKVISAKLRSEGKIVLCVATSGIAALLMEGGRTAHSKFHIPIKLTETSTCDIFHGTEVAELIQQASLIIWDEAPMAHKFCMEALDRTLRDLLQVHPTDSEERPFGGVSVVFGGDFRQILPVIKKGTRSEIISGSLKKSYLWEHLTHLRLFQNMRLMRSNCSQSERQEIATLDSWLKEIGDGVGCSILGEANILIPPDLMVGKHLGPIQDIVKATYPDILHNYQNAAYLASRAVLAPHHDMVHKVNAHVLSLIPGEEITYLSSDSIDSEKGKQNVIHPEFPNELLNSLQIPGFPDHEIKLKVGVPIILLRNIDQAAGLCNGTRMVVKLLGQWFIEAEIISGSNIGESVFLPRMTLTTEYLSLNIVLSRRQYPNHITVQGINMLTVTRLEGSSLSTTALHIESDIVWGGIRLLLGFIWPATGVLK